MTSPQITTLPLARTPFTNNKGSNNTADGHQALQNNTTGTNNVAVDFQAGNNLTTGSNNIAIGAGVTGVAGEANTTRIGKSTQAKTLIGGIYGKTVASGTAVTVRIDSTGKLGTVLSSARFKEAIKPMDEAGQAVLKLKPVIFRYKPEFDVDGVRKFGLIAEDVKNIEPDLVVRDGDGKVSTVRYDAVNAMLLNEFLKEHRKVEALEGIVTQQQKQIAAQQASAAQQQKEIEATITTVREVSKRAEPGLPAPRLAVNED